MSYAALSAALQAPTMLAPVDPPRRLAFTLAPDTLRELIPPRTIGAYLLLDGMVPIYVGRSDHCLRDRLSTHNHRHLATHVLWQPTRTRLEAYLLEAFWFHGHRASLINKIHPGAPTDSGRACPFCESVDAALEDALGRPIHTTNRPTEEPTP